MITLLTALWDRILDACDVDRQVCRWARETHEPMEGEDS